MLKPPFPSVPCLFYHPFFPIVLARAAPLARVSSAPLLAACAVSWPLSFVVMAYPSAILSLNPGPFHPSPFPFFQIPTLKSSIPRPLSPTQAGGKGSHWLYYLQFPPPLC